MTDEAGPDPAPRPLGTASRPAGNRGGGPPEPTSSSGGPQGLVELPVRLVAGLALLTVVVRLPGFGTGRPFNTDETSLAVGGRALAFGGQLYVDVIDRKPPLPFAAYAVLRGWEVGAGLVVMRAVVAALVLVTAVVIAHEAARRFGSRAAWVAGTVVVAGSAALGPTDAQAANFELFALLPIAVAFTAGARGRAGIAGAALAVAVLCKQPAAITVVPVALMLWRAGRWRSLAMAGASGLVAAVVLAVPFGAPDVVRWALLGAGGYLSLGPGDVAFTGVRLAASLGLLTAFWGGAWLLALAPRPVPATVGPPVAHDRAHQRGGRRSGGGGGTDPTPSDQRRPGGPDQDRGHGYDRSDDRDLWWFLAASVLGVVAGFRFFPHYLIQLLPALALLAARGAVRRPARVPPAMAWLAASTTVAVGLAVVAGAGAEPSWERPVAQAIADNSCADDRVLVWGNVPELYWRAERLPAGGFTHSEFLTGYSGGRRHRPASEADVVDRELYDDWIERVREQQPAVIVDTAAADLRGGRFFPLRRFGALRRLVDEDYEQVAEIERIRIYVRTPRSSNEAGADRTDAGDEVATATNGCSA